jgi:hypothetical protein
MAAQVAFWEKKAADQRKNLLQKAAEVQKRVTK